MLYTKKIIEQDGRSKHTIKVLKYRYRTIGIKLIKDKDSCCPIHFF